MDGNSINFREFDKKLKLFTYLRSIENVELINNVSEDVNNKLYYNFVVESGLGIPRPDSTSFDINDLLDDKKQLNIKTQ